ncbi:hypothetical protein PTKIN_Ptkin19aG0081200 [Pterospermum kingtungense]
MASHQECMDNDVSDFLRFGQVIQGSQFVSVRSCLEFEPEAIHLLCKLFQKPVVPVGLLPPLPSNEDKRDEKWEAIKAWLDSKREKSVFYVELGSEVNLSQEFMHQLAFGFEERVSDRGLVLSGWAPPLRILDHSSTGGFLTHCGWSSIIEGLSFCRALILFFGVSLDQGLNARLMHGKKVGLEIERDEMDGSFSSDLVARTIRQVMVEPEGGPLRANAWAVREIFGNVALGNKYLDHFAQFIEEYAPATGKV